MYAVTLTLYFYHTRPEHAQMTRAPYALPAEYTGSSRSAIARPEIRRLRAREIAVRIIFCDTRYV